MSKKRRGRGENTFIKRADGTWYSQVSLGYRQDGKRDRRTVSGSTKEEVADQIAKLRTESISGKVINSGKQKLDEFLVQWLEQAVRLKVTPATRESYEDKIRLHINPVCGAVRLDKICAQHVHAVLAAMHRKGLGLRMQQYAYRVMSMALKQAVMWGLIPTNPCAAVPIPKPAKSERPFLTAEQVRTLYEHTLQHDLYALLVLATQTGARQGELLALKWEDVDFKTSTLRIRRTVSTEQRIRIVKEPKTRSGRRGVTIPEIAIEALHDQRKRQMAAGCAGSEWIFTDKHGNRMHRSKIYSRYRTCLKKAGLPRITFHDLRHTHASLLLSEGLHPKIMQERLGHANIGITLDLYAHCVPGMQGEVADKLNASFPSNRQRNGSAASEKPA